MVIFCEKNSIDELPQIFNVLLGNMSLVGPRPHPIALDKKFEKLIENYNDRYNVLPGITGLAQVSGFIKKLVIDKMRNRVLCDIKYGENLNLYLDLEIIMKTFLVIFKGIWFFCQAINQSNILETPCEHIQALDLSVLQKSNNK